MRNDRRRDFMSDHLFYEKPFRVLTIANCFTMEALATAARTNFAAIRFSKNWTGWQRSGIVGSIRVKDGP